MAVQVEPTNGLRDVTLHLRVFEQLRSMAVHGADARALITKDLDTLN
ncbi:hypothetical protein ACFVWP_38495 [Streptomyces sp. NPDC058175]